jgi:hypothetical protein
LIKIHEAENQIITDYEVCDQRPADSTLLIKSIEAHQQKLGRVPDTLATDAGFCSPTNETAAVKMGVKRVAIPNRSTLSQIPVRCGYHWEWSATRLPSLSESHFADDPSSFVFSIFTS